ncbi:MAG TPA: TIR domain-containing protein [Bryobacteraceae bacterium]|nr:TIR domain-containing protein [Bryobacteraceae bacterium]
MANKIKLRLGNLFDGPSDLIVLPCSTSGTVTGFVARSLADYDLPHPREGMLLGEVEFLPFEGAENIAQFVGFAASVDYMTSSLDSICAIGRAIGDFTQKQSMVRAISAPLLGAGAGGLQSEKVVAALRRGFEDKATADSCLTISILHQDVYERLRANRNRISGRSECTARVFISHTSRTKQEEEWVKNLALYLIEKRIQVRLDKFHLRRGMDLPQWMCNELALADRVVIVSNESYKAKADGRMGGVGWETMIIQGDIAGLPSNSTKYQVIVRSESLNDGLPLYLKTRYVFHARPSDPDDSFHEELVKELLGLPLDERLESKECYL